MSQSPSKCSQRCPLHMARFAIGRLRRPKRAPTVNAYDLAGGFDLRQVLLQAGIALVGIGPIANDQAHHREKDPHHPAVCESTAMLLEEVLARVPPLGHGDLK